MHVDLDQDNALRYQLASQNSGRSARKIINSILRAVDEAIITEIIEIKLKDDKDLPEHPEPIKRTKIWKLRTR